MNEYYWTYKYDERGHLTNLEMKPTEVPEWWREIVSGLTALEPHEVPPPESTDFGALELVYADGPLDDESA